MVCNEYNAIFHGSKPRHSTEVGSVVVSLLLAYDQVSDEGIIYTGV